VARLGGLGRGHVRRAIDLKCLWLTANCKDLKGKSPVICRAHRDPKLLKALAQALLRKPQPLGYCTAAAKICNAKI
jgi:hypothetical protein